MLSLEDLARIRVDEAIQKGLREQHHQRILRTRKKSVSPTTVLRLWLALFLGH